MMSCSHELIHNILLLSIDKEDSNIIIKQNSTCTKYTVQALFHNINVIFYSPHSS